MSCPVCRGHDTYKCPSCGPGKKDCPDCYGGLVYWSLNIHSGKMTKVTELAYRILPFDEDDARAEGKNYCQGEIERCLTCNGEGEVPA